MRRRAEEMQRQLRDQDRRRRAEAAKAAEAARAAGSSARPAAYAGSVLIAEEAVRRIVTDDLVTTPTEVPQHICRMLKHPNWRSAIIMAEILGPPIALRDPQAQSATAPPCFGP